MTARTLIKKSLRKIGVLATGENPSADQQKEAFETLQDMIDSWSLEGLVLHQIVREAFTLVPGTTSYAIGTGATFNTERPVEIDTASVEDQSVSPKQEYPVDIISAEQWAGIQIKDLTAANPFKLFYNPTAPNGTLYVYPSPTIANKLVLYSKKTLTQIATVSTELLLPPGYNKMLINGLAIELGPEYGWVPDQVTINHMVEAKANVKRANMQIAELECDAGVLPRGRGFNINTGESN